MKEDRAIVNISGNLMFQYLFVCEECGCIFPGTSVSLNVSAPDVESLQNYIRAEPKKACYMPIGWSSYFRNGETVYVCKGCKEKHNG